MIPNDLDIARSFEVVPSASSHLPKHVESLGEAFESHVNHVEDVPSDDSIVQSG